MLNVERSHKEPHTASVERYQARTAVRVARSCGVHRHAALVARISTQEHEPAPCSLCFDTHAVQPEVTLLKHESMNTQHSFTAVPGQATDPFFPSFSMGSPYLDGEPEDQPFDPGSLYHQEGSEGYAGISSTSSSPYLAYGSPPLTKDDRAWSRNTKLLVRPQYESHRHTRTMCAEPKC